MQFSLSKIEIERRNYIYRLNLQKAPLDFSKPLKRTKAQTEAWAFSK
jgi:hypothetical protein